MPRSSGAPPPISPSFRSGEPTTSSSRAIDFADSFRCLTVASNRSRAHGSASRTARRQRPPAPVAAENRHDASPLVPGITDGLRRPDPRLFLHPFAPRRSGRGDARRSRVIRGSLASPHRARPRSSPRGAISRVPRPRGGRRPRPFAPWRRCGGRHRSSPAAGDGRARGASAKGRSERAALLRHALRSTLLSATTIFGFQLGSLFGGAIITETIFAWPGIGRLTLEAIQSRDYPLVQGCVLVIALGYVA